MATCPRRNRSSWSRSILRKQLRIEAKIGSLEAGKDADFVIWNGHPLSNYTRVDQTWIDGRKYFDRAEDIAARKSLAAQREALVQKALAERVKELAKGKNGEDKEKKKPDGSYGNNAHRYTCSEE